MIRTVPMLATITYLLFFISGCAAPPKPRVFWPIDEPKIEWLGNYSNSNSFPKTGAAKLVSEAVGDVASVGLKMPIDAVSDSAGNIFITDISHNNIIKFDFTTNKTNLMLADGILDRPMGIAIDSKDQLYVVDVGDDSIKILTAQGIFLKKIVSQDHLSRPGYIAVNERLNRLYVSDAEKNHIAVFDLEGVHLFNIGSGGSDAGKFHVPQGIAINATDEIFVADLLNNRIQAFDNEGTFIRAFGKVGDQVWNFEHPKDLDFDSDGNLHIVDDRKGMLLTYTPDGTLLLASGGAVKENYSLGMSAPKGIFIDSGDRIIIVDAILKRFMLFQFLSEKGKAQNPVTPEDLLYLQEYLKKQQK